MECVNTTEVNAVEKSKFKQTNKYIQVLYLHGLQPNSQAGTQTEIMYNHVNSFIFTSDRWPRVHHTLEKLNIFLILGQMHEEGFIYLNSSILRRVLTIRVCPFIRTIQGVSKRSTKNKLAYTLYY